jgi:ribosomal protein S18 acetylase RimI-like enzyme
MSFTIRRLTGQDGPLYQHLRLVALQQNPEAFLSVYEAEVKKAPTAFADELEYALAFPSYGYYGIFDTEQNNALVAFGQISKSFLAKQKHIAWVYNLFVDSAYRRRGLARTLLEHMEKEVMAAEKIELCFVGCNAKNKPAIKLYHRLGFRRCGIHPRSVKWRGEYDDEIQLVKVINHA